MVRKEYPNMQIDNAAKFQNTQLWSESFVVDLFGSLFDTKLFYDLWWGGNEIFSHRPRRIIEDIFRYPRTNFRISTGIV